MAKKSTNIQKALKPLCWPGCKDPPPVPRKETWKNTYLIQDEFWNRLKETELVSLAEEAPMTLSIEEPIDQFADVPLASDVLRFRLERGDMPAPNLLWPTKAEKAGCWDDWVFEMLDVPEHKMALHKAGILSGLNVSVASDIKRDKPALGLLLSRWNCKTHTFMATWGEFTPTLEDVVSLLELPVVGDADLLEIRLSEEEKAAVAFLKETITKTTKIPPKFGKHGKKKEPVVAPKTRGKAQASGQEEEVSKGKEVEKVSPSRANFAGWIRFFYGEKDDQGKLYSGEGVSSEHRLAALIAMWLCRCVFCGPPYEGMNAKVFPIAVKMAQGVRFALAPAYLGTLYKRLDQGVADFTKSKGRYDVNCFVDANFLQMFLLEHFDGYSQGRVTHESGGHRAWSWQLTKFNANFKALLDDFKRFVFRPYALKPDWVKAAPLPFSRVARPGKLRVRAEAPEADLLALLFTHPHSFLSVTEKGEELIFELAHYNPHRVARQLGFDQGVPSKNNANPSLAQASASVLSANLKDIHFVRFYLSVPTISTVGGISPRWAAEWESVRLSLDDFMLSPVVEVPELLVSRETDPLMSLPSRRKEDIPEETGVEETEGNVEEEEETQPAEKPVAKPKIVKVEAGAAKAKASTDKAEASVMKAKVPVGGVKTRSRSKEGSSGLGGSDTSAEVLLKTPLAKPVTKSARRKGPARLVVLSDEGDDDDDVPSEVAKVVAPAVAGPQAKATSLPPTTVKPRRLFKAVVPQSEGPYSAEQLKERAEDSESKEEEEVAEKETHQSDGESSSAEGHDEGNSFMDVGLDGGKGDVEEAKTVAPSVVGEGHDVASQVVGEGGAALSEAPSSSVVAPVRAKISQVEVTAPVSEVAGKEDVVGGKRARVEDQAVGDEVTKRMKETSEASGEVPEAMAVPKTSTSALKEAIPEAMAVPKVAETSLGKATLEAMAVPKVAEVSSVSPATVTLPPLHDASAVAEEASTQMVIFRGCRVSAPVLASVNRLEQAIPGVFAGLILKTSAFLAIIYETVAKVINVLDRYSPSTLPSESLNFLEAAAVDLEVSGVDVSWLRSALSILRQVQGTKAARVEVERLRQVALEATSAYEAAKLLLDEQIRGVFDEGMDMTSSYSTILKI